MVDSSSVVNFENKNTARKLNLLVILKTKTIALVDSNQHTKIVGEAIVDVSLNNKTHLEMIAEIIKDLSTSS